MSGIAIPVPGTSTTDDISTPTEDNSNTNEFISVLDENGVPMNDIKERNVVHKDGLWHRVALVCIMSKTGEILLQRRSSTVKKFANLYDISVATHVLANDSSSLYAAKRAINQELGFPLPEDMFRNFQYITCFRKEYLYGDNRERQFHDLFLVKLEEDISLDKIDFNKGEVQSVSWEKYNRISRMMNENSLFPRTEWIKIIKDHANRI